MNFDVPLSVLSPPPLGICSNTKRGCQRTPADKRILIYDYNNSQSPLSSDRAELKFDSHFESGNLLRVWKVIISNEQSSSASTTTTTIPCEEYDLELLPDPELDKNNSHLEWFYFSVSSPQKKKKIKFNIVGLLKREALFRLGMQPVTISALNQDKGWERAGDDLSYFEEENSHLFTFSFSIAFESGETKFIAESFPYTTTDLKRDIKRVIGNAPQKSVSKETIARSSINAFPCEVITITSPDITTTTTSSSSSSSRESSNSDGRVIPLANRPGVIIQARIHPGETASSWICRGVLEFLISRNRDAVFLRNHIVFKIIPMLNIDGVIKGCSRNATPDGIDLNRAWINPINNSILQATKNLVARFSQERRVLLFVDLHGHSKKLNSFTYGCSDDGSENGNDQLLPRLLSLHCGRFFSPADCTSSVSKNKNGAARVVFWKEFGIKNSYTLETSMCGFSSGTLANTHFSCQQYMEIGKALCLSAKDMWNGNDLASSIMTFMLSSEPLPLPKGLTEPSQTTKSRPVTRLQRFPKAKQQQHHHRHVVKKAENVFVCEQTMDTSERRREWNGLAMPPIVPTAYRVSTCQPPTTFPSRTVSTRQSQQLQPTSFDCRPLTVIGSSISGPLIEEDIQNCYPPSSSSCPPIQQQKQQPSNHLNPSQKQPPLHFPQPQTRH